MQNRNQAEIDRLIESIRGYEEQIRRYEVQQQNSARWGSGTGLDSSIENTRKNIAELESQIRSLGGNFVSSYSASNNIRTVNTQRNPQPFFQNRNQSNSAVEAAAERRRLEKS